MAARIFQRTKNPMQSGRARLSDWVLEFESARAQRPDPLTGWTGGAETQEQVILTFPTKPLWPMRRARGSTPMSSPRPNPSSSSRPTPTIFAEPRVIPAKAGIWWRQP